MNTLLWDNCRNLITDGVVDDLKYEYDIVMSKKGVFVLETKKQNHKTLAFVQRT